MTSENLLEVQNLNVFFKSDKNPEPIHAVRNLSFHLKQGEMLGVVGESGSGKSITNLAMLGILGESAIVKAQKLHFNGRDLLTLREREWQKVRGGEISMIFQDPMTALNPFLTVEFQLMETILAHKKISKIEARELSIDLLTQVGITSPAERLKAYPFELSGGMAQRVMIAMAISTKPKLLIADEPTTALDVTIQKQILTLIKSLQEKNNMSVILVTHDLGVVSEFSERVQVMYAGELVETRETKSLIKHPFHPYSYGLLQGRPGAVIRPAKSELPSIPGIVPAFHQRPSGCQFHPRCPHVQNDCKKDPIALMDSIRCLHPMVEEVL
jgi:oligopeptide/dipeptide ABC transporter ATP-binding protein